MARDFYYLILTALFVYGTSLACIGFAEPGGRFSWEMAESLNYVGYWRTSLLRETAFVLRNLGFSPELSGDTIRLPGQGVLKLSYSCIGYGTYGVLCGSVMAGRGTLVVKSGMLVAAFLLLFQLNVARFALLLLYWKDSTVSRYVDHHLLFNAPMFILLLVVIAKVVVPARSGKEGIASR